LKAIHDRAHALATGLAAIREQYHLPQAFPPAVLEEAERAAKRTFPTHRDRSDQPFVTLDPTSSTDLDQAFAIEPSGSDILLHYAIADVASFVDPGGTIDREAWARGETVYLPDGKVGLYPPILSEGVASLLPDGPRPAVLFTVRIDPAGAVKLDAVERAIVKSRAKLGYATVTPEQLPGEFFELARRIAANEASRGASRVDPPQQEVVELPDGSFALQFRTVSEAEIANAALSLAANMAIADTLYAHHTGLFRVMPDPDKRARRRVAESAKALGIDWPKEESLQDLQRRLNPNDKAQAALMLAIRRSGAHAAYEAYKDGERPWHWAMAATYVHATAPLRRLADRYVIEAAHAVANGRSVPEYANKAFQELPAAMAKADAKAAQVGAAAVELAEAVELQSRVGQTFDGQVTDIDQRGARVQLCGEAIIIRVSLNAPAIGDRLRLKLVASDPAQRRTQFVLA
jgi:exoribonuclease R